MKQIIYLVALLALGISCKAKEETATSADFIQNAIDSEGRSMIQKPLINAVSIGVYYDEKEYIGHYGELEKGKGNAPDNETIYEIGSLSKVLAGTLLAKAVTEQRVSLEHEIQLYLNEGYPNLAYENHSILIKHLLTHTSGLPNMLPLEANEVLSDFTKHSTPDKLNYLYKDYSKSNFFQDLHSIQITNKPGFNYSYSSIGTELIAHVLEMAYETDYEELLTSYLSNNVGSVNTKILLTQDEASRLAVGYHSDNKEIASPMPKLPWGASGNVKSTIPDMLNFIKFQLNSNSVVEESHRPVSDFKDDFQVAYFWNVVPDDEKLGTFYIHHGGVPRSQCYIYIVPKFNLGVFIVTNQSGDNTASLMEAAIKEIFDKIITVHNKENSSANSGPKG